MNNYKCKITWNTHCGEETIQDVKKKLFKFVKLNFWNVGNLNIEYERVKKDDNRKKT